MNGPIAVLAGTPVDTRMGVAYLEERGLPGVPFPLSRGPREQTAFQHAPAADKRRQALAVLRGAMAQGCRRAFVYCNSLSAAVDFPGLAEETGMRIVTPLDVYRRLALRYRALGVIAANAQGLSGIEKVLLEANPALDLLGACALPVVLAVEAGMPPEELVERYRLAALAAWFADGGMEALVLGCTHFPLLKALIGGVVGRDVTLISSAQEAAHDVAHILSRRGALASEEHEPSYDFYTTGEDVEEFRSFGARVFRTDIDRVGRVAFPS